MKDEESPEDPLDQRLVELREKWEKKKITEEEEDELIDLINKNHLEKRNFVTRNSMKHQDFVKELFDKYC